MDPCNEQAEEVREDILQIELMSRFFGQDPNPRPSRLSCVELTSIFLQLSEEVREIFAHVLRLRPHERWGLDNVLRWGLDNVFPRTRFMYPST